MGIEVLDSDPTANAALPTFTNLTVKCLILRQNMTIGVWNEGEQKMYDYSMCLAK